jgi:phenylacetic acid degradation operon negative regulatory protein
MTADPAIAAAQLVARYRRQRPLRGGSLIVTIFGDAIMPRGGAVTLGSLIALAAPFGLNERLVRTATARLAKDGWLEGHRAGKRSEYHLSHDGRERFAEATRRIYGNAFAHPELDSRILRAQGRPFGPLSKVVIFDANLADDDAPQRLVSLGWDLEDLSMRYQRFVKRFERVLKALHGLRAFDAQACFIVRTLLIHEYRRLHLRDPLLPARLLKADWPGAQAAALCRDIYARVFAASEAHLSRVAAHLGGPLPAPDASVMQRFGGISA